MKRPGVKIARKLRRTPTDPEKRFWAAIRARQLNGAKFRRQYPIGAFIADFVCLEARLVVEIDGGQHNESSKDAARTAALEAAGYRVMRFWNNDVLNNLAGVLETLSAALTRD
ncbi:MAG: endonuclease domain-containing protein [Rhodospirillaceae bacterium]